MGKLWAGKLRFYLKSIHWSGQVEECRQLEEPGLGEWVLPVNQWLEWSYRYLELGTGHQAWLVNTQLVQGGAAITRDSLQRKWTQSKGDEQQWFNINFWVLCVLHLYTAASEDMIIDNECDDAAECLGGEERVAAVVSSVNVYLVQGAWYWDVVLNILLLSWVDPVNNHVIRWVYNWVEIVHT